MEKTLAPLVGLSSAMLLPPQRFQEDVVAGDCSPPANYPPRPSGRPVDSGTQTLTASAWIPNLSLA